MKQSLRALCVGTLLCALLLSATPLRVDAASAQQTSTAAAHKDYSSLQVIPGGVPFGVKFTTDGVLVVGFCDIENSGKVCNPAREAGLRIKDVLTHVNGQPITSAQDLTDKINACADRPLSIQYTRGGKPGTATLTPIASPKEGGYKSGLYVRDSGAGIGTLTYVIPGSLSFAGLGHGICDGDTGELMPLHRGRVVGVTINGIKRGVSGTPGELRGYFDAAKNGTLLDNTPCGVFGVLNEVPPALAHESCSVATRDQIHEGDVSIICTLSSNQRRTYSARIYAIDRDAKGSKCFTVQITDPTLLEETGGIVQGMSGSPILQDGKLIGAVTHVLIGDPSRGYGIFIENMLDQTQASLAKAS